MNDYDKHIKEVKKDRERYKKWQQERLILIIGEVIAGSMKDKKLEYKEVDNRLKKPEGYIKNILEGEHNITIKELSDILFVMNKSLIMAAIKLTDGYVEFGKLEEMIKKGEI
jgi:hypothetical protein